MENTNKKNGNFVNYRTNTFKKKKTTMTISQLYSKKQISRNLSISRLLRDVDYVDQIIKSVVTSKEETSTMNPRKITKITPCKSCGFLHSQNDTNIHNCNSYIVSEDPTIKLPDYYVIMYCQSCQSYSYTGTQSCHKLHPEESSSLSLLRFLLGRLGFYFRKLQLVLLDAWIVTQNPRSTTIKLNLVVQFQGPNGSRLEKECVVEFAPAYMNCPSCSDLIDEAQLKYVVQLRQQASQNHNLRFVKLRVLTKHPTYFNIKKMKHKDQGMDFFFANKKDAEMLCKFLVTETSIKPEIFCKKFINHTEIWYISAVMCHICPDDLIYLPQNIVDSQHVGPLVICISSQCFIKFLDPLKLTHCRIHGRDYWKEPFEALKTKSELVEYQVLDVMNVASIGQVYSLANVRVKRVSCSDQNGTEYLVKTHLGNDLKPGDHALGYELCGAKFAENCKYILPIVVLVKKKKLAAKQKKESPEYQQFLGDLEKNPEAMFKLSLNDREGENQTSEMVSENLNDAELELEELLADLDLSDQQLKNL